MSPARVSPGKQPQPQPSSSSSSSSSSQGPKVMSSTSARSPAQSRRRHERFVADIPCRIYVPGDKPGEVRFEAHLRVRDLSFGGAFIETQFQLRGNTEVFVELRLPDEKLPVKGRIMRQVDGGMGIAFDEMAPKQRAVLLRHFVPENHKKFYESIEELVPKLGVDRVSLILHLWEEWRHR
jgi:hypothetical protein